MTSLTLEALTKIFSRAGTVADAISLRIEAGEFFTLLGPSGCGKSTVLRMIAGFEEPTSGRVLFGEREVTFEPPNRRNIGFVFQNYALFPHMSVAQNVAFGLSARKIRGPAAGARVAVALKEVQLTGLDDARIDQLSGGQQQRVALARALVIEPELLLLDEPLSNLDAKLREETRAMLRALHKATGVTAVYVTHDQAEAMGMSSRIAILYAGRIQQVATPEEIYDRPANRFVAGFIGRNNVLEATIVRVEGQAMVLRFANGRELSLDAERRAPGVALAPGAAVAACLRAESLRLTSGEGTFQGVVSDVEYGGAARSCLIASDAGPLQVEVPASAERPANGDRVGVVAQPAGVFVVGAS